VKDFSVVMLKTFSEDDLDYNGGYAHAVANAKLFITKENVKLVLSEDEIKDLVKTVGATFRR